MEGFLLLVLVLVAVWLMVRVLSSSSDLQQVQKQMWPLNQVVQRLERQFKELQDEVRALQKSQQSIRDVAAPATAPAQQPSAGEEVAPAPAPAEKPAVVEKDVWALPKAAYRAEAKFEAEPSLPEPTGQAPHLIPAEPPPPPKASEHAPGETPPTEQPAAPPPPPPPIPPVPVWEMPKFDWEGLIGVKLFSWIAGVAMVVAAIFFLNYSIDRGWLQPPVQMTIGIIAGLGLLLLCELKAANKYRITANAMDASAVAILFATFYAAYALWHLINPGVSFIFLVLVAVVAVLLSIRRDSLFIALLGLVGGFATPALLSSRENHPITLFGYLLLLNAGLAWIASKKKWPLLTTLALVLTTLYQWGWVMKFLTAGQLPLSVGIFLVFPILTFVALTLGRKEETDEGWVSLYGKSVELGALLPVLFAAYLASVSGYGSHYVILFGFLFVLAAGLFAIAVAREREILHLAGGISTLLVFAIWFSNSYDSVAWPAVLAFILLFVMFYLAAPLIAGWFGRGFTGPGSSAVFVAPLLLSSFAVLAAIEPLSAAPGLIFGVLFLLLAATAAFAVFQEQGPVYFLAAFSPWRLKQCGRRIS